jgi:hypothetical protein
LIEKAVLLRSGDWRTIPAIVVDLLLGCIAHGGARQAILASDRAANATSPT